MDLVDTHVHLDDPAFDGDRDEVVARARAAGVRRQVVPAIDAATWPRLRDCCAASPGLHAAYGLHPLLLADHRDVHLDRLRDWIERERPVAVGECGLDYYVGDLDRDAQRHFFEAQLRIARVCELPVIVHARRAVEDVIIAIRKVGGLRGVAPRSFQFASSSVPRPRRISSISGIGSNGHNRLIANSTAVTLNRVG